MQDGLQRMHYGSSHQVEMENMISVLGVLCIQVMIRISIFLIAEKRFGD